MILFSFSKSGRPEIEQVYTTHYVDSKTDRIVEEKSAGRTYGLKQS